MRLRAKTTIMGNSTLTDIAVVLPTRGLVFTQVEQAIEECRLVSNMRIFRSHDLPIPDGHNQMARLALKSGCKYIWIIEEDVIPPAGALAKLLQVNSDIACIDYGVSGWGCVTRDSKGEILWCGLGCTLIKREVLETLEYPWFRVDKSLSLNDWQWHDLPELYIKTKQYGSLDIWFCDQARQSGFKIAQAEGECDHLNLVSLGKRELNFGLHEISLKPKIEKKQVLDKPS